MKFGTAINCMDGRVQTPIIDYIKTHFQKDVVDMITEPGPIKVISENKDKKLIASIKKRLEISVYNHGSDLIAVVGHFDCAGNPSDEFQQKQQIKQSITVIRSWGYKASLIGLWVNREWEVKSVN
ncbi:carbonic anhydrase [Spirochaeta cellobiosiphila]|uniref:carbonic anhydrase n=1 Tax=Spirochaeta cellobiosiphila TaxID=504483 RepID=UPI00049059B2|nr:carbonic anhydrase [Spirochaeta cellobiosiphila]